MYFYRLAVNKSCSKTWASKCSKAAL